VQILFQSGKVRQSRVAVENQLPRFRSTSAENDNKYQHPNNVKKYKQLEITGTSKS